MNRRKFALCGIIITMAMGALVGWSISIGNPAIPVIALIGGMAILYLCKSRVDEVIEDERIHRISEKASRMTFQFFIVTITVVGAVSAVLSKSGHAVFKQIGLILNFSVCALLGLYLIFFGYYSRKYGSKGGDEEQT